MYPSFTIFRKNFKVYASSFPAYCILHYSVVFEMMGTLNNEIIFL